MNFLYLILWGLVFVLPQMGFKHRLDLLTLLVIYAGFSYPFLSGIVSVMVLSYFQEVFSLMPHGSLVTSQGALFCFMQLLVDRIYTESYLTKSIWVLFFSILSSSVILLVFARHQAAIGSMDLWISVGLRALFNAVAAFPLFIILDVGHEQWIRLTTRRQASLTGADLFQAKSSQRKYI